jgi:RNA polymerase sigma-70 factor (ECF subfamily)
LNEEQIINEIKKGNLDVFPQLINLYKNRVFAMSYKFTDDYNEAQDLSQEIFLKVYRQIENFRFESKLSTWIYKISINTCIDWKKKKNRFKVISFTGTDNEDKSAFLYETFDKDELPENKVIELEQQQEIHRLVSNLPDIYKTVIILYHFNNMSYSEISSVLEIPEKTVETRLYRARRKLKQELIKVRGGGEDKWNVKKC